MKTISTLLASLIIVASSSAAFAKPPPGKGRGQSPAKWEIQKLEADLKDLEQLERRGTWKDPQFVGRFSELLTSARNQLDAIKRRDPSWPTDSYRVQIDRFQQTFDRNTHHRQPPPPPPPPPRSLSPGEKAIVDRIAQRSSELVRGKLHVEGRPNHFDDERNVDAFTSAALRADYKFERQQLEEELRRSPHLRHHPTIAKFIEFENQFRGSLDALIIPEIARLLDTAYANRTRNKPFGIAKGRAALDLIAAVRLVTDHPRLDALEKQGHSNMNELARGVYPTGFHAEHVGRVALSRVKINVGRESRIDLTKRLSAGQHLYGVAYLDKLLREIAPHGSTILVDTRLMLNGREIGFATKRFTPNEASTMVIELPIVPLAAHVGSDDRPAALTKILSRMQPGRHILSVAVTVRAEGKSFKREVAEGSLLVFANQAGVDAWSRLATQLSPAPPPPPPAPPPPPLVLQRANPNVVSTGQPPPPPPPAYTPPPVDPNVANAELPREKVQDAGALNEAYAALQRRFGKRPLKAGFATHWNKGEQGGNKFRKITVWAVWPDDDHDGVAQIESFEVIAWWNTRLAKWNPLEFHGTAPHGPRYQILVSKVVK